MLQEQLQPGRYECKLPQHTDQAPGSNQTSRFSCVSELCHFPAQKRELEKKLKQAGQHSKQ